MVSSTAREHLTSRRKVNMTKFPAEAVWGFFS